MKLKKDYERHLFERKFKFADFIEFEGDEIAQFNSLLNKHSSVLVDLQEPSELFLYLEHVVFTSAPRKVCRTSFARKQYESLWISKFSEISPLLGKIFKDLYPLRSRCLAYTEKIERHASMLIEKEEMTL